MGFFLRSEFPRGDVRNFLNVLLHKPTAKLGIPTPLGPDIFGATFLFEEPFSRALFLGKVPQRPPRNAGWNFLLPRMPGARALNSRSLPVRDSARIAISMNHTFAASAGGFTYSLIPFPFRVARKAGIRVTAPYANSHPCEWIVTFADRPFLSRRDRIPSFISDTSHGSGFRTSR